MAEASAYHVQALVNEGIPEVGAYHVQALVNENAPTVGAYHVQAMFLDEIDDPPDTPPAWMPLYVMTDEGWLPTFPRQHLADHPPRG